jgi:molecular chaperone Hsp33
MADEWVSAILKEHGLRVVLVNAGGVAREGRRVQQAQGAAATLFGLGLSAGLLMGALLKDRARVHLQLECAGPLRGIFVDANAEGDVRGYVKNAQFAVEGEHGRFRWRPALGNSGFLSVLRDLGGGEYYRSSVELKAFDLAQDLQNYYTLSEQTDTLVRLESVPDQDDALGSVAGLLIQLLPQGDRDQWKILDAELPSEGWLRPLLDGAPAGHRDSPSAWMQTLFPRPKFELEMMGRMPVRYHCGCSMERVQRALLAVGPAELEDMIEKDGKAEVTCEFCGTLYRVLAPELRQLLQRT